MPEPVSLLRAAAARLRQAGEPLTDAGAEKDWQWAGFFTLHGADLGLVREDEEWIALMSPALAQPLAAWLDDVAERAVKHEKDGWAVEVAAAILHRMEVPGA